MPHQPPWERKELRRYVNLLTRSANAPPQDPLRLATTVDLRRVEQPDTSLNRSRERLAHLGLAVAQAVPPELAVAPRPGANAKGAQADVVQDAVLPRPAPRAHQPPPPPAGYAAGVT